MCDALINVDMYDTKALAYVMTRGPNVFAISISMQAGNGVALPVAVMAAVAAVAPVVIAMTGPTVNTAAAMTTATVFRVGINLAGRMPGQSRVQARDFV